MPLIDSIQGINVPKDVTSSTNTVFVIFQTDGTVTKAGFRIIYTAVRGVALRFALRFISVFFNSIIESPVRF